MTIFELETSEPKFWIPFFKLLDKVLTVGIYDSDNFRRAHREYLFSYISGKNQCQLCCLGHKKISEIFDPDIHKKFDSKILEQADSLYNNTPPADPADPLTKQILYTIAVANSINFLVNTHKVIPVPSGMMHSAEFNKHGYAPWLEQTLGNKNS